MQTIQQFAQQQRVRIINFSQTTFTWDDYKSNHWLWEHEAFRSAVDSGVIPDDLHRDWVLEQFKNPDTFYLGYLTALMWGGVNATRPVSNQPGNLRTTNFYQALSVPKKTIVENLLRTQDLINQNRLKTVHEHYLNGDFKIPGIGESYFTKLLFFAGYPTNNPIKPLIYDKWTKIMHVWLLLSDQEYETLWRMYSRQQLCQNVVLTEGLLSPSTAYRSGAYVDYVQRMNHLAQEINADPSTLESFLFGTSKKGVANKQSIRNPRVHLIEQVRLGLREVGLTCR